jgi:hypothetical protein
MVISDTWKNALTNKKAESRMQKNIKRYQRPESRKQVTSISKAERLSYLPKQLSAFLIHAFYLFTASLLSAFLITCSESVQPDDTVTFSGTVTFEDTTDFSGVKVSLYKPVELDTALVRINQEYPNIGVQISQETEFDHREHEPLYTTLTNADGAWKIENVTKGEYNVVAEKDSFGWKYDLEFSLTNNSSRNYTLYPIIELSGNYENVNLTLMENRCYLLEGNVIFNSNSKLTLQNGTTIICGKNANLILQCDIESPSMGFARFTSDDTTSGSWKGIEINKQNIELKNLLIQNAANGIKIDANMTVVNSIYAKNTKNISIIISNGKDNITIINSLLTGGLIGIDIFYNDSTININKNIIYKFEQKGIALNNSTPIIQNNCIIGNYIGIDCQLKSNAIIKNNNIEKSDLYGIKIGGSNPIITYNNFLSNKETTIRIPPTGYAPSSIPRINYNNFNSSKFHIVLYGDRANANKYDVNSKYNWWGTTDIHMIQQLIYDKNDLEIGSDAYKNTGSIIFQPYEMQKIENAGIKH